MSLTIVDVAGLKKSGKTTVVENLVSELSGKGYHVGTIKKIHIPGFTIDQDGKDTFRHKRAGADFVISLAPEEIALIKNHQGERGFSEIEDLIPKETDFLICEELNEARNDILYIVTLKDLDQLDETLRIRAIGKNIIAISGIVAKNARSQNDLQQELQDRSQVKFGEVFNEKFPEKVKIINSTTKDGITELVDLILENSKKMLCKDSD